MANGSKRSELPKESLKIARELIANFACEAWRTVDESEVRRQSGRRCAMNNRSLTKRELLPVLAILIPHLVTLLVLGLMFV